MAAGWPHGVTGAPSSSALTFSDLETDLSPLNDVVDFLEILHLE